MSGRQDIVGTHHEHPRLNLAFYGKRQMYGHLITVEVCVKGGTDERM